MMANVRGAHAHSSRDLRFPTAFTVMILLVGMLSVPAAAEVVPVNVQVEDQAGNPVGDLTIRFVADGVETFATTDIFGFVQVDLDPAVQTEIHIEDPRFQPFFDYWDGAADVWIQLASVPIPMTVHLASTSPEPPPFPWSVEVFSDGSFDSRQFAEIFPGESATFAVSTGLVIVVAHRDTLSSQSVFTGEVWIDGFEPAVELVIPVEDVLLTGSVVSSTGAPIENAMLLGGWPWFVDDLFGYIDVQGSDLWIDATANAGGEFAIDALPGSGVVFVDAPGFEPVEVPIEIAPAIGPVIDLGLIVLNPSGESVGGTGSASTDNDGEPGASPSDPLETSVTSPNGSAEITITESTATGTPPTGYGFVGQQIEISAPPATADDPLTIVFTLDASQVPAGEDHTTLQVTRNGVLVADCAQTTPTISPDPCVSDRALLGDGDVQITVLTSAASMWHLVESLNSPPTVHITAPEDGSLYQVGAQVSLSVAIDDDPGDDVDCTVSWGDDSVGACSDPHSFNSAGVFTATVTVTDSFGATATDTVMLVVYDPDGGFVTGGGWIDSPAGAYILGDATGKASFGFVSRYRKGANVPDGETEFVFSAGGLQFHSTSYDWLVVSGDTAQFKGAGAVNGEDGFRFKLWASDEPDEFRIKIWSELDDGSESIVYDNGANQALGGGSIVVHGG